MNYSGMDVARISFNCSGISNWAEPDPSGEGTILKDVATLGHNLFERAFENNGTRFQLVYNMSKADGNVTNSSSIQTIYDGKADISLSRYKLREELFPLVDFMFPVWVSVHGAKSLFWQYTQKCLLLCSKELFSIFCIVQLHSNILAVWRAQDHHHKEDEFWFR